jgi:hypothetical protein
VADANNGVTDQIGTQPVIGVEVEGVDQPHRHYQGRGAGAVLYSYQVAAASYPTMYAATWKSA